MLEHPVRREHQQPPGARRNLDAEIAELRFTALFDIVEVTEEHHVPAADGIDGIEVGLEGFLAARAIALQDQAVRTWPHRDRNGERNVAVVARKRRVDLREEESEERLVGEPPDVQLGPCAVVERVVYAAPVAELLLD